MDNVSSIRPVSELVKRLCLIQQLLEDRDHVHFLLHFSINMLIRPELVSHWVNDVFDVSDFSIRVTGSLQATIEKQFIPSENDPQRHIS